MAGRTQSCSSDTPCPGPRQIPRLEETVPSEKARAARDWLVNRDLKTLHSLWHVGVFAHLSHSCSEKHRDQTPDDSPGENERQAQNTWTRGLGVWGNRCERLSFPFYSEETEAQRVYLPRVMQSIFGGTRLKSGQIRGSFPPGQVSQFLGTQKGKRRPMGSTAEAEGRSLEQSRGRGESRGHLRATLSGCKGEQVVFSGGQQCLSGFRGLASQGRPARAHSWQPPTAVPTVPTQLCKCCAFKNVISP